MAESIPVRNPRNGQVDYRIRSADSTSISARCSALRDAQRNWQAHTVSERVNVLLQWRDALRTHADAIIESLVADTGRYHESVLELETTLKGIERWCALAPNLLVETEPQPSSLPGLSIGQAQQPYPVVGVISPWNFPLLLSLIDAIPALLCGCAVAIKPSEITPRFCEPLWDATQTVPELAAVLALFQGDGRSGAALLDHVDMVIFTGSVATGRKVGEAAAARFIPAFLELGGKDPAIVLPGADLTRSAAALAWGGMANAGQSCLSIERVYVQRRDHDTFIDALQQRVAALRLCTGQARDGQIGPIIAARQAEIIQSHLDDAYVKGAVAVCGGQVREIDGGLWCEPTVLRNVDHRMRIMTEETFGPVLPVMAYDSVDEAIALANDSAFGLSAAVFGADSEAALGVARHLQTGAISINDCALTAIMHEGEKQSFKLSGLGGSRMGPASLRRFLRKQALLINVQQQWDPWWFPSP